jgi:hypothetical protein
MAHPLDGARFKVVWAQKHLDSLKDAIGRYLNKQVNEISSKPHGSPYHPWLAPTHVLPNFVPDEPEMPISGIIGDCVTNTRAALDYIMWELAERYFTPSVDLTDPFDRNLSAFPIFDKPFTGSGKSRFDRLANRGVPADAVIEIEAVQQYKAGYEPFLWLNQLVSRDKHRVLLPTAGEVNNLIITFAPSPLFPQGETVTIPRSNLKTIGMIAMQSDMQMKGKVSIHVTWKNIPMPDEPVDRTLEQIIKCVADIVQDSIDSSRDTLPLPG